jgi:type II secretion system protein G
MEKKEGAQKGFTLIELMIVVAIIGILASIAIPNFLKARDKAMYTKCVSALSGLKVAQEMYISDKGIYASDINELAIYMIPGCTDPTGGDATCGAALEIRIENNCADDPDYEDIINPISDYEYELIAKARDRTKCHICMDAGGYSPSDYQDCETADGTCVHSQ